MMNNSQSSTVNNDNKKHIDWQVLIQLIGMILMAAGLFYSVDKRVALVEAKIDLIQSQNEKEFIEVKEQRNRDLVRFEKTMDRLVINIESMNEKLDNVRFNQR